MSRINANISNLFRSAAKATSSPAAAKVTSSPSDAVKSPIKVPPSSSPSSSIVKSSLRKLSPEQKHHDTLKSSEFSQEGDPDKPVVHDIPSMLMSITNRDRNDSSLDSEVATDDQAVKDGSVLPWFYNRFNNSTPLRRQEIARDRKNKWMFNQIQRTRFDKLVRMCFVKLGLGLTSQLLHKLGRQTGLREYNAFIKGCLEMARKSLGEKGQYEQVLEAYQLLQSMKERGLPIEEDAFGPLLLYLIDMHMDEHFLNLLEILKEENASIHPRLGYYEMLFWIEMNNEKKIQELCEQIAMGGAHTGTLLHENYMLALCERDRKEELLQLLYVIDITKVSSYDTVASIFRSLGRLSLKDFAELFLVVLKDSDHGAQKISDLIFSYTSSLKNTEVEDVILKFREMHSKLELALLAGSYEKLISLCLDSAKVPLALDLVDEMCESGLCLSTETLNSICHACDESCEYMRVRRIYSMISHKQLKPNSETFRCIINLNVRMKAFDCAYAVLKDLEKMNLSPTASMYNAILAGYYREENMDGVLRVLEHMKDAGVKPDSETFGYLISNCTCEEDILKYYEQLMDVGVKATKHVYMALIEAYAACGKFVKAKEVVQDKGIPGRSIDEIKSALVSSLASHGNISDALDIYEEIKQSGRSLEPKAIISLIEHQQSEGNLNLLLQLLEELSDAQYWADGCCQIILYCIRNKDLRTSVGLLKRLYDKFRDDDMACRDIFDKVFSQVADMESPNLQIGLDLFRAIQEDLKSHPSRNCLDFLLSLCVNVKDLQNAQLVWNEYQINGLPHNILGCLRMYQAYLVSGDMDAAASFLNTIPKDDPHVRSVLHACCVTYGVPQE